MDFFPRIRRCRGPARKPASTFVGPSADLLELFGDKTAARKLAEKAGFRSCRAPNSRSRIASRWRRWRAEDRLSADPQGCVRRRRTGHARGGQIAAEFGAASGGSPPRGWGGVRQRRGVPGALRRAGPPHGSADSGRPARQHGAPVRARLLRAAAASEGGRSRAGGGARSGIRDGDLPTRR